jgi:ABC-type uncharacterized transport system involved in gliding motility auxiliary subunit
MMPAYNGTGPLGMGQFSGRGMGRCREKSSFFGRFGRRFGRGQGFGFSQPVKTPADEKSFLENDIRELQIQLEDAQKRLEYLVSHES